MPPINLCPIIYSLGKSPLLPGVSGSLAVCDGFVTHVITMFTDIKHTVVFRPTVQSLITLAYELSRSGTCHGSLGRSNRVTFCPKKESLSKKKFSAVRRMPITKLIPSPNPHLLPCLDGHATTLHYTSAQEAMNPSMDLLNMLVSKH